MSTTYRQGDVLLFKVESLPQNAKPAAHDQDRIVLAYGEVTGHAHALSLQYSQIYESGQNRFIVTTSGATLTHEEHGPIELKPGTYLVVQQREYVQRTEVGAFIPMVKGAEPRSYRPVVD